MSQSLPAPVDDGLARHLLGMRLPNATLASTAGGLVSLADVSSGRWVLFIYPRTGVPGEAEPDNWESIPGAKGCTKEACSFRDRLSDLVGAGAEKVIGLSVQPSEYQREAAERLHLPYPLLSDMDHHLTDAMRLPTFTAAGLTLLKRLTMIVDGDTIRHVFYPVFPVEEHTEEVLAWLGVNPTP